jgi:hypothetical protein
MSVFGPIHNASETVQPRHVLHWLWIRLIDYLGVAAISLILFFVAAFLYASFSPAPPKSNPVAEPKVFEPQTKPISPPSSDDLMVSLPSGQQLPFEALYKGTVTDNTGELVGHVVGLSPESGGQHIVVSVQDGGASKTVGVPTAAFTIGGIESKKSIRANLPREAIIASPTYVNIGGTWQPTSPAPISPTLNGQ